MKKTISKITYSIVYITISTVVAVSIIATICGDGDKGLFELLTT